MEILSYLLESKANRDSVGTDLSEKLWSILQCIHRHDYVPPDPTHDNLDAVYETNFPDVQPYLFKVGKVITKLSLFLHLMHTYFKWSHYLSSLYSIWLIVSIFPLYNSLL